MKKCPNCGSEYGNERFYCLNCGSLLESSGESSDKPANVSKPANVPENQNIQQQSISAAKPAEQPVKEKKQTKLPKKLIIVIIAVCAVLIILITVILTVGKKDNKKQMNSTSHVESSSDESVSESSDEPEEEIPVTEESEVIPEETEKPGDSEILTEPETDAPEIVTEAETAAVEVVTEPETEAPAKVIENFAASVAAVTASSQLNDEVVGGEVITYSPARTIDGDLSSCWSEGVSGNGEGESFRIDFNDTYAISQLEIWNGLCKSEELYYKNSRINEFSITFSDGETVYAALYDGWEQRQSKVTLAEPKETSCVIITIKSVYAGNKYQDTCVSEISVS